MTPKQTVHEFFDAWQYKTWGLCLGYVQISWKHEMSNPQRSFWGKVKDFLSGKDYRNRPTQMMKYKLDNWDVSRIDSIQIIEAPCMNNSVVRDACAKIKTKKGQLVNLRVRIIKELGVFKPHKNGTWGINPASIHEVI